MTCLWVSHSTAVGVGRSSLSLGACVGTVWTALGGGAAVSAGDRLALPDARGGEQVSVHGECCCWCCQEGSTGIAMP